MTLNLILAAFGGGLLGAVIGALPAFILTGIMVIAGLAMGPAGPDIVGGVAFGTFLGPHIAFAGGVAAAVFSHRRGKLEAGGDITVPLSKFNDPMTLIVGGIFGVIGLSLNYLYADILHLATDTVALTVVSSGIIARIVFGRTGIFGKCESEKRAYFPVAESLMTLIVMGIGLGLVSGYFAVEYNLVTLGFGISAASLIFNQMGFEVPGTHHITLVGAVAAAATGNLFIGALFGAISAVLCDAIGKTFNSYCDSHIDPPAGAIFILTTVVLLFL